MTKIVQFPPPSARSTALERERFNQVADLVRAQLRDMRSFLADAQHRAAQSTLARAIARHKDAQDRLNAARDEELAARLAEEATAFDALVRTTCANDASMLVKLRYLLAREVMLFGNPSDSRAEFVTIAQAVALHFERERE